MESRLLTDLASVSSSLTHSTDLSNGSTSNQFSSITCNLTTGVYADNLYSCQSNPKHLKKLNFVVCSERSLEIHDAEKSYRRKRKARYIIDLASVYSITKRSNEKISLCIMLATTEQTFYLRALTESATHEWYDLLFNNIHTSRTLIHGRQINLNDFPEGCWDVNVCLRPKFYRKHMDSQMTNLCAIDKKALGRKRLCFFHNAVVLIQMHTEPGAITSRIEEDPNLQDPEIFFYFARPFISFFGIQRKYFFIKASTSTFGTCEVVAECESVATAKEIFTRFQNSANKNANVEEDSWRELLNDAENEDDEEDEYYNPKRKGLDNSSTSSSSNGMLTEATSYCIEDSLRKKPFKEVRFKTEDQLDLQSVGRIPKKASIDDGIVGQQIAADIIRRKNKKSPKKSTNPINGLFATLKKKFQDKNSPSSPVDEEGDENEDPADEKNPKFRGQIDELRFWAEKRCDMEETEDSGGTLKIDDPQSQAPKPHTSLTVDDNCTVRRDGLFTKALVRKIPLPDESNKAGQESIEMVELPPSNGADEAPRCTSTESSNCDHPVNELESDTNQKRPEKTADSNSSSVVDSCISNTSGEFSATSSVSNVEFTWKPVIKKLRVRKQSADTRSCAGRYTSDQSQGQCDESLSVDSCYSSLTNHGYRQLPKSQSLTQLICESPIRLFKELDKKLQSKKEAKIKHFGLDNREVIETPEEPVKASMKTTRSSNDLASAAQQISLKSTLIKQDDPDNVAAAIRQRAASLGNKSWAITPLGHSLKQHHRHRQDCKKRKMNASINNSLSEEQPLVDNRHSSISSQSDHSCSHKSNASAARTRLAHALLSKNPRRSNTSDLTELTFLNSTENGSTGFGSIGSIDSSDSQRGSVHAFGNTNKSLIPTTRYSEGSTTSARRPNRTKRAQRNFEMDPVECFLNPDDFDKIATKSDNAASVSSRDSGDDVPRCKHGKPKRQHHNNSNHSLDSAGTRHSCRRKHRTSCQQDAIVEEDYVGHPNTENAHQRDTVSSIESKTLTGSEQTDEQSMLHSDTSSQKSEDQPTELIDLINNNPNPVSIFA